MRVVNGVMIGGLHMDGAYLSMYDNQNNFSECATWKDESIILLRSLWKRLVHTGYFFWYTGRVDLSKLTVLVC